MTPTQRSLAHYRKAGYHCEIVEHHIPWPKPWGTKRDLLGFGDILVLREAEKVAIIQTTSGGNLAARRKKIIAERRAQLWLQTGGRILLNGWAKKGPRGKKKVWTLKEEEIKIGDFSQSVDKLKKITQNPTSSGAR